LEVEAPCGAEATVQEVEEKEVKVESTTDRIQSLMAWRKLNHSKMVMMETISIRVMKMYMTS
jgi:hypothetical protein